MKNGLGGGFWRRIFLKNGLGAFFFRKKKSPTNLYFGFFFLKQFLEILENFQEFQEFIFKKNLGSST